MFYHVFYPLSSEYSILNVFKYITFRSAYAGVTALVLSLVLGKLMIRTLLKLQIGERIRSDGPQHHSSKSGTPTMGGLLILATFIGSTLLWADLSNHYIWLVLLSAIGFGAIGLWDDFLKLRKGDGITAKEKIVLQIILSLAIGVYLLYFDPTRAEYATRLSIPFFKSYRPDLGFGYLIFIVFIIVGTSNAVNLTDGLDGLAILSLPHSLIPASFISPVILIFQNTYVFSTSKMREKLQSSAQPFLGPASVFFGITPTRLKYSWVMSGPYL
jgi:phospho-N-acetylmuramoyl-pentapeptide-transferase